MFDLEMAINAWRRQSEISWSGDKSALDELEDHLREETATLTRAGHSERDAWTAALTKLGDPAALRREFVKVERLPTFDRVAFGAMLGVAAVIVAAFLIFLIGRGQRIVNHPVLTIHVATITLGYLAGLFAAAFAGYAALRAFLAKCDIPELTGVALKLVRITSIAAAALTLLGFVFGAIWANAEWGKPFNMDPREIGALVVIASILAACIATLQNALPTRISLTIAIAGGAAVVAASFGIAAHAANYPPLLTAVTVIGLAILFILAALSLRIENDAAMNERRFQNPGDRP
jgi:Cytochrome C assembly protein